MVISRKPAVCIVKHLPRTVLAYRRNSDIAGRENTIHPEVTVDGGGGRACEKLTIDWSNPIQSGIFSMRTVDIQQARINLSQR